MEKTVLITGASRGIGREMARAFAQAGYQVVINYCASQGEALALEEELNARGFSAMAVHGDVQDRDQVRQMFRLAEERFGQVDVLINNAGIAQQKLFTDLTDQDWDSMFGVDVKGVFLCTQAALPGMIRRQQGKIINISSMWGITGASCEVHYSAAKAAVIGMTKALAKELGPSHINVNCIAPGVIDTQMNAALSEETLAALKDETPLGVIGTGNDIAQLALFLASPQSDFITGQVIAADGGMTI